MSGRRKIIVGNRKWRYKVGKCWCVARAEDNDEGRKVSLSDLTGLTNADIERGQHKRWFSVTPRQISDWLAKAGV